MTIENRPATHAVVTLISEDNGGHLLQFYGTTDKSPEQVVERMIVGADVGRSPDELAAIEAHLATLTEEQRETIARGEEDDAHALSTPAVSAYLEAAFEVDVLS
jgi:hypothetical protein